MQSCFSLSYLCMLFVKKIEFLIGLKLPYLPFINFKEHNVKMDRVLEWKSKFQIFL